MIRFSRMRAILHRNPISRAVVLTGACLAAVVPFFWWGSPSGHDFEFHMFSWMEVLAQWKQGIVSPQWAALAHWGYGEARFLFYPPASWTLGAALGRILPWKMVPGAYCVIALALAGAAMYRLAREWLAPSGALFAALFYALNPYHLVIVYWRSAYAELLAAALLPLLPFLVPRLNQPGYRPTLWLSLTLAAAWLTNVPAAVMIHYSTVGLAVVLAVMWGLGFAPSRREMAPPPNESVSSGSPRFWHPIARILVRTALAVLLGAGLASFTLLPAIHEQGWVNLSEVMSPGVRPPENFLFTILDDPDHNRFNFLVSSVAITEIVVLVLVLAICLFRREDQVRADVATGPGDSTGRRPDRNSGGLDQPPWILLSAWAAASVLLMLPVSNLLWQHLPELRYVQLPFRWLLCMNAAFAMLLAMATKRWSSRLAACALLLAAVIAAGHRFQSPWWDTAADITEMSDAVADGTGYEGTDEYVPAGADPYELNKGLPRVSDDTGAAVQGEIRTWGPAEKHFTVHAAAPQNLIVRLFSYPAWTVIVNGKPAATQKTDVTGLLVIPIAAGDSDVRIYFCRTMDRYAGDAVSMFSLAVFVVLWIKTRPKTRRERKV